MFISELTLDSRLGKLNPFTKFYLLLFTVLITSFYTDIHKVVTTSILLFFVILIGGIEFRLVLKNIRLYSIALIPFLLTLSYIEHGYSIKCIKIASLTYLRFFNIIVGGAAFVVTTSPSDIALLSMKSKKLRNLGIALFSAFSGIIVLKKTIQEIIFYQGLRGARFSFNLTQTRDTYEAISSFLIPAIIRAAELSQNYSDAFVTRGYTSDKAIQLPPRLRINIKDKVIITITTIYTIFIAII